MVDRLYLVAGVEQLVPDTYCLPEVVQVSDASVISANAITMRDAIDHWTNAGKALRDLRHLGTIWACHADGSSARIGRSPIDRAAAFQLSREVVLEFGRAAGSLAAATARKASLALRR